MKKLIVLGILFLSFLQFNSFNAQEEQEKKLSFETQFDVFSRNGNIIPNLKARYFFNADNVLRTTFSFQYNDAITEILENNGTGVGSVQKTNSLATFSIGYEKHFIADKFSPYIGAEFIFGFGNHSTFGSRTDSLVFVSEFNYSSQQRVSQLGFGIFTGVDIPLYKGLYCGTEIGYMFLSSNLQRGEYKTENAASTTNASTVDVIPSVKTKSFSLVNMGGVRVGWKF